MKNSESCVRCTFLFTQDTGYSNYTVTGTELHCVMRRNPNLPAGMPDDYGKGAWIGIDGVPERDKWVCTKDSRCEVYQERPLEFPRHRLDVDGEVTTNLERAKQAFLQGDVMPLLVYKYVHGEEV